MGITSESLIDNCLKYATSDRFTVFHADATFKLSDLGYPVISCGFTDRARSYQLAALFVVSRRTTSEYAQCFRSLARLFKEIRGRTIHVDAVMGDAEDAQANALESIPEFSQAQTLMCFFHVLYNVRKKNRHLKLRLRKTVMKAIMEMHFCESFSEFTSCRDASLAVWRTKPELRVFADYFELQWLTGRFWRWQAFHTPSGFATTNNPCEVFNSGLKSFFQRRRWHMRMLLQKLRDLIGITNPVPPVAYDHIVVPTTDVMEAANLLVASGRITVQPTDVRYSVLVRHTRSKDDTSASNSEDENSEDENSEPEADDSDHFTQDDVDFMEAFDATHDPGDLVECDVHEPMTSPAVCAGSEAAPEVEIVLRAPSEWEQDIKAEREKERAAKLYNGAVKWALKRSHEKGMPVQGWRVDTERCVCSCKYYAKFTTCAHVVAARLVFNMGKPGVVGIKKLHSRIRGKKEKVKAKIIAGKKNKNGKTKKSKTKTSTRARARATAPLVNTAPVPIVQPIRQPVGRPPLASSALDVQYILNL